jgi:hypothetical protein
MDKIRIDVAANPHVRALSVLAKLFTDVSKLSFSDTELFKIRTTSLNTHHHDISYTLRKYHCVL